MTFIINTDVLAVIIWLEVDFVWGCLTKFFTTLLQEGLLREFFSFFFDECRILKNQIIHQVQTVLFFYLNVSSSRSVVVEVFLC